MSIQTHNIPEGLKALGQWVNWRYCQRAGGKPTKVPYQTSGALAKTNHHPTWNTFEACFGAYQQGRGFDGIGFCFSGNDGLTGIDLDNCLNERGDVLPWAQPLVSILEQFAYIEASPSGLGLKAWIRATGPERGKRFEVPGFDGARVEVYPSGRFFTVTGWAWPQAKRIADEGSPGLAKVLEWITEQEGNTIELEPSGMQPKNSQPEWIDPPQGIEQRKAIEQPGRANQPGSQAPRRPEAIERARLYLESCPPAISGAGGHPQTLAICGAVAIGFDLSPDEALEALGAWNERCIPPWTPRELSRKVSEAIRTTKKPRGYLLETHREDYQADLLPPVHLEHLQPKQSGERSIGAATGVPDGGQMSMQESSKEADAIQWAEDATPEALGITPEAMESLRGRVRSFRDLAIGYKLAKEHLQTKPTGAPFNGLPTPSPGFLQEFTNWQLEHAPKPQPDLALMGAVCALAVAIGRKVRDEFGTRPNLQCVCLAETGEGKDFARKAIRKLLTLANCPTLIASDQPGSDTALLKELAARPSLLWLLDEAGRFLATTNDAKSGHTYGIKTQLLTLYSSASNAIYQAKSYSDSRNNIEIRYPHLVLYATTTPGQLLGGGLGQSDIEEGLIPRQFLIPGATGVKGRSIPESEPPARLVHFIEQWARFQPSTLASFSGGQEIKLQTVPAAALAMEVFQREAEEMQLGPGASKLWVRAFEKCRQLAIVSACSRIGPNGERDPFPAITLDDARWAIDATRRLTSWAVETVDDNLASNARERALKDVARLIREAGPGGLSRSTLTRRTQRIDGRTREDLLRDLIAGGQVISEEQNTHGRPSTVYKWGDLLQTAKR